MLPYIIMVLPILVVRSVVFEGGTENDNEIEMIEILLLEYV